ncbi:hypothetical protein SK128_008346, partial [Halocaridina rubra]
MIPSSLLDSGFIHLQKLLDLPKENTYVWKRQDSGVAVTEIDSAAPRPAPSLIPVTAE